MQSKSKDCVRPAPSIHVVVESYAKKMTKIFFHCDILDFLLIILYFYVQIMFTDIILDA